MVRLVDSYQPLSRGHIRWQVIRDCSDGMPNSNICEKWGVSMNALERFKTKFRAEIEEMKRSVEEEMHGLWIARKRARIEEYEQTFEDLDAAVQELLTGGGVITAADAALIKEKRGVLRAVAEELGQLPNRNQVNVQGATVSYNFQGINPDDLK